uniref:Uncharacterized protein n=1 Tax=Polytomella parva TaxID=51329 RepID=A0A7S0V0M7_9CHLO|mmetsp:Transcript_2089/g.3123  ORF Transcript_2089/g.3123 Transcript_2089/m.3123 type:complete len:477 (-) Transcript_2089:1343-2773(-)
MLATISPSRDNLEKVFVSRRELFDFFEIDNIALSLNLKEVQNLLRGAVIIISTKDISKFLDKSSQHQPYVCRIIKSSGLRREDGRETPFLTVLNVQNNSISNLDIPLNAIFNDNTSTIKDELWNQIEGELASQFQSIISLPHDENSLNLEFLQESACRETILRLALYKNLLNGIRDLSQRHLHVAFMNEEERRSIQVGLKNISLLFQHPIASLLPADKRVLLSNSKMPNDLLCPASIFRFRLSDYDSLSDVTFKWSNWVQAMAAHNRFRSGNDVTPDFMTIRDSSTSIGSSTLPTRPSPVDSLSHTFPSDKRGGNATQLHSSNHQHLHLNHNYNPPNGYYLNNNSFSHTILHNSQEHSMKVRHSLTQPLLSNPTNPVVSRGNEVEIQSGHDGGEPLTNGGGGSHGRHRLRFDDSNRRLRERRRGHRRGRRGGRHDHDHDHDVLLDVLSDVLSDVREGDDSNRQIVIDDDHGCHHHH